MRKSRTIAAVFCFLLILVLVLILSGLRILESTVFHSAKAEKAEPGTKTIVREGVEYYPRQDITTVLLLGIDEWGPVESSGYFRNFGEADTVALLVLSETSEACRILYLNRDTMVDMPALGMGNKPAGRAYGQLALAHTYGDGLQDSCENVRKTVSGLLGGVKIDHYVALRMDAIAILTDAVGGVPVTVTEDFSQVDASIPTGAVRLKGEQAVHYVQIRKNVGSQMNITRMERQKDFMAGFVDALKKRMEESDGFVVSAFDAVSAYVVTDCSVQNISDLMTQFSDYELEQLHTPQGENVQTEEYFEFYVDQEKLDRLVLEWFYEPKAHQSRGK